MRISILVLLLFISPLLQAQVSDDFNDGDFTTGTLWEGAADNFLVNGNFRLQLNDDMAAQSVLSTTYSTVSLQNKEWRIWVKHSFSGSANNFTRIYLSSSTSNLSFSGASSAGAQGYFIQLGESGSEDAIRLFRDDNVGDAIVEVAAGTLATVAGSFELSLRILRDDAGNWQIFYDPNGGDNYQLEATGTDAVYSTSTVSGLVCTYTISNADAFQFDDFYFGDQIVDEELPVAIDVTAISATECDLTFSEALDPSSAENPGNYSVDAGVGSPVSVLLDLDDPSLAHLTFASAFPENTSLQLSINDVADLAGNVILPSTLDFSWIVGASAEAGDVVFNEVLADPTPALGLPAYEFVELYNATSNVFDLEGWEFINTTTSKVLPSHALLPGEFVILCDLEASAEYEAFGNVIAIDAFTALSNTGDSLTLLNAADQIIDVLVYSDDWYGSSELANGGVSLERINPFEGCAGAGNWSAAQNFMGGTPGAQNSNFSDAPDLSPPVYTSLSFPDDQSCILQFNELLSSSIADEITISMSPDLGIANVASAEGASALAITFNNPFMSGTTYLLTIEGIADCAGNILPSALEVEIIRGSIPQAGDLIITEIMAAPDAEMPSPNAEYIEVYNATTELLELSSIRLNNGGFTTQVLLEAGAYLVLTDEEDLLSFLLTPNTQGMEGFPGLANSGSTLLLSDANENIIDQVSYDDSWYGDAVKAQGGYSLERISLDDPCSDQDNWTGSNAANGHTAGFQNSVFSDATDEIAPIAELALVSGTSSVDVYFNEQLDPVSGDLIEAQVGLFSNGQFEDLGYLQGSTQVLSSEGNRVVSILFDGGFSPGVIYALRIVDAVDCWGNLNEEALILRFAVPEDAVPGDLIINEVLFDPYPAGVDFVELYNRSSKNISLQGWQLANEANGIPENFETLTELPLILYPGEYIVFCESVQGVISFYPNGREDRIKPCDDLPSYGNTEGVVVLADSLFMISDRMSYDDNMHYPLLDDTEGVSLERIDPFRASDDRTNWHSASSIEGFASPGYENSQFMVADIGDLVSLSPDVFSPDNDGFEDQLLISFALGRAGFTGSITIYDDGGRLIRKLVNNELLGIEGTVSWDGVSDDRRKASIGMYIVYFEAFHPDGSVISEKHVCTLGHRLN